jgi:phosphatidylglycerol---prolipoprotein diacylglyceryl transferase
VPELSFQTSGFLPWIDLGFLRIQTYFVLTSLVLSALAFLIVRRAQSLNFSTRQALDLYIFSMIGGFFGARLFHILWEEPSYYLEDPWRVFDILQGGFVWYGGLLGGLATLLISLTVLKKGGGKAGDHLLAWLDLFTPIAAVGYGLGRLACVLTGCCYGGVCHLHEYVFRFPTQGFAVAYEIGVASLLVRAENHRWPGGRKVGQLFFLWLVLHGIGRIIMELLRDDPRGPEIAGLSIASVMSLIFILLGLYQLRSVKWSGFLPSFSKLK